MRIYIGNLSYQTNDEELRRLFEAHGEVVDAKVITDRQTGRSRGFGFVEMRDEGAGDRAIEALNQQEVGGRTLNVNRARPRNNDEGGQGGRGRRRDDDY